MANTKQPPDEWRIGSEVDAWLAVNLTTGEILGPFGSRMAAGEAIASPAPGSWEKR